MADGILLRLIDRRFGARCPQVDQLGAGATMRGVIKAIAYVLALVLIT